MFSFVPVAVATRWAPRIVLAAAVAMIPWMLYLGLCLPSTVSARHWQLAWVGLDVAGLAALAGACWLAHRRDPRALPVAIMNATLVAAKIWFGMSTSPSGHTPNGPLLVEGGQLALAVCCLLLTAAEPASARPVRPAGRFPRTSLEN
ncbi:hypothetical protein P3T36_005703 [Kitasatospora sp. MAP12-15]|uniref:hypothetical protein n=1 Tax=unclassified Kitasatospora TaxID=2633591 RepID=UPI00247336CA|nr:hypothetical protein [Kitasatospora sp. MAP12-44]MDH6113785.1 hypothetical protein [Kitasatospora sp. MAP12-44]